MKLDAISPEVERFIDEQVNAGRFATREAVVEAAVAQMMLGTMSTDLDDADLAAIRTADEEIARGEAVDFHSFAADMRKKYCER